MRIKFWGPQACFVAPSHKADPRSFPVPPPTALNELIRAIYWHPQVSFTLQRLVVLNPIAYQTSKQNMLKSKGRCLDIAADRTQRLVTHLTDVAYELEFTVTGPNTQKAVAILSDRATRGACHNPPYFGWREYRANFALIPDSAPRTEAGHPSLGDIFALPSMPRRVSFLPDPNGAFTRRNHEQGGAIERCTVQYDWFQGELRQGVLEFGEDGSAT